MHGSNDGGQVHSLVRVHLQHRPAARHRLIHLVVPQLNQRAVLVEVTNRTGARAGPVPGRGRDAGRSEASRTRISASLIVSVATGGSPSAEASSRDKVVFPAAGRTGHHDYHVAESVVLLAHPIHCRRPIYGLGMFWQLTIDANDPAVLARFWAQALGYQPTPPAEPETSWYDHYRTALGEQEAFDDRIFDPAGLRPPLWFQEVPEEKAGKNRVHLDLYPTNRDDSLALSRRIEIVEAKVAELLGLGATVELRNRQDDPADPFYFVVMHDPEGNEFCVS
jgi:hypothetical protein